jgi:hypothetical protein
MKISEDMKIGQVYQRNGLPYVVTDIVTDYDPYLWSCKHVKAKNILTGAMDGWSLQVPNPYCDIDAVLNGTKISRYSEAI